MKCSLGISNFFEEISSLSHPIVFLYFFALIPEQCGYQSYFTGQLWGSVTHGLQPRQSGVWRVACCHYG